MDGSTDAVLSVVRLHNGNSKVMIVQESSDDIRFFLGVCPELKVDIPGNAEVVPMMIQRSQYISVRI
ncbi:MAG TPA: hypothetical protein VF436_17310 [Dyella sp.]